VALEPAILERYVGDYLPERGSQAAAASAVAAGHTVDVRRFGTALYIKAGPMLDRLWPVSEQDFFVKEHFGTVTFVSGVTANASALIYREGDIEVAATRIR
jgi:hypothetical protein